MSKANLVEAIEWEDNGMVYDTVGFFQYEDINAVVLATLLENGKVKEKVRILRDAIINRHVYPLFSQR